MSADIERLIIRPEMHGDYKKIVSLVLRSFREGTDYSDGTDIVALIEEIRDSEYYIPELAFVAELDGEIVGHFLFSRFPLSKTPEGGHSAAKDTDIVMLAPVSVHADHLRQGIGTRMLKFGIEEVKKTVSRASSSKATTASTTRSVSGRHPNTASTPSADIP